MTREQIDRAKQVDILDYILTHEPDNVRRIGNAHFLKDHDSLCISNGLWIWRSRDIGGKNVVDYLIKVRGYSFVDAVQRLSGKGVPHIRKQAKQPRPKKPFSLPPRNGDNVRVIAYLQKRGIAKPHILDCIKHGSVYESAEWHNCVFVGRDDSGIARYATIRGTMGDFKRDADGSDKKYGFVVPPESGTSDAAAVFESPVDTLSHQTLNPGYDGWRLSLGSTSLMALTNFLERHGEVKHIAICTDNDDAGNRAAQKIAELPGITTARFLPFAGKDWNDALLQKKNEETTMKDVRQNIRFITPDYKELFTIKDGDSIKITMGFDGEEVTRKCRFIDEAHLYVGNYSYHIYEFAEKMEKAQNKAEPVANPSPEIDILAGKYGEELQQVTIPMTETSIRNLVGGDYDSETLYNWDKTHIYGVALRGKEGMAVCGIGGINNPTEYLTPTSLHPYWVQKYKSELSPARRPNKPSLLGNLEKAKADAAAHNAMRKANDISNRRSVATIV